jgi:hypothetical protein
MADEVLAFQFWVKMTGGPAYMAGPSISASDLPFFFLLFLPSHLPLPLQRLLHYSIFSTDHLRHTAMPALKPAALACDDIYHIFLKSEDLLTLQKISVS